MKKAIILIAAFCLCALVSPLPAQTPWQASLTVDPFPSPFLSDWETDPGLAMLELENSTAKRDVIVLYLTVENLDTQNRFTGRSQRLLVESGELLMINNTGFRDWITEGVDNTVKNQVMRSGMLPEGQYEVNLTVRNLWDTELAGPVTGFFSIVHPEPPELVWPVDDEQVSDTWPLFQWIPPQMPVGKGVLYNFKLCPVLPVQTPSQALLANYPHYEGVVSEGTGFEYPPDAQPLEAGQRYVWQVQALDLDGRAATKNSGYSELGLFQFAGDDSGFDAVLELISPEDGALVSTNRPVFQWLPPVTEGSGPANYQVTVTQKLPGQSGEQAMVLNAPQWQTLIPGSETSWVSGADAPALSAGRGYAWQVQALDDWGDVSSPHGGSSEISSFTVDAALANATPWRLLLPEASVAYIDINPDEVLTEPAAGGLRIRTEAGRTADWLIPALACGGAVPRVPVVLDVVADTVNWTLLEGEVTAGDGTQAVFSTAPGGIELDIMALNFKAGTSAGLMADVKPVLPRALSSAAPVFRNLSVMASGLSGTPAAEGGNLSLPLSVPLGTQLTWVMGSCEADFSSDIPRITFGGHFEAPLFSDTYQPPEPLPFTAVLMPRELSHTFDTADLENDGIPMGQARFYPLLLGDAPAVQFQADWDRADAALQFNGMISFPLLNQAFSLCLKGLSVGTQGVTLPDMHAPPEAEQVFTLFGSEFVIRDNGTAPAVAGTFSSGVLTLKLAGDLKLLNQTIPFENLTVRTDGSLPDRSISSESRPLVNHLLTLNSVGIVNKMLALDVGLSLPNPFDKIDSQTLTLQRRSDGSWNESQLALDLTQVDNPARYEVSMGIELLKVPCRLTGINMNLHPKTDELSGNLTLDLVSQWPGLTEKTDIPLSMNAAFSSRDSQPQWQALINPKSYECNYGDILKLSISQVSAAFDEGLRLSFSGSLQPNLPGIEGDGVSFENFKLYADRFVPGTISEGYFNIQGFEVYIYECFLDMNAQPFEFYTSDDFGPESVEVVSRTANPGACCLKIGGRVKFYKQFDCNVDQLLIYSSQNELHVLVDNAELRLGMADLLGNVDLEYHHKIGKHVEFQLLAAGDVIVDSYRFVLAGEMRFNEKNDDMGFGLFVGAGGLNIQLGPLPIYLQDLGGGVFYQPDERVEELVIKHCRLENSTTINERFSEYKTHDPDKLALFLYGGFTMPDDKLFHGRALVTCTSSHLRIDNEMDLAEIPELKKANIKAKTFGHFEIALLSDFYAEGNLQLLVTSNTDMETKIFNQGLMTGTGLAEFWVYDSDVWGIHASLDLDIINTFESTAELYIIPSGILAQMERGGTVYKTGIVDVSAGLGIGAWAKWEQPRSYGGFINTWVEAEVLWGVAAARGELGALLKYEDAFYFYGLADLTLSAVGFEWNGKAWAKWQGDSFTAGLGGDDELEAMLEETKALFEEMIFEKEHVLVAVDDGRLNHDWFQGLELSDDELEDIVNTLISDPEALQAYSDLITEESSKMLPYLNSGGKSALRQYRNQMVSLLSPPDFSGMGRNKTVVDDITLSEVAVDDTSGQSWNYMRTDTVDFRRIDPNEIKRLPPEEQTFRRQLMEDDHGLTRTLMPNTDLVRRYPAFRTRYAVFSDTPHRIKLDEELDDLIAENRRLAAAMLDSVTVLLDSLESLSSITPPQNPLQAHISPDQKRMPQRFSVDNTLMEDNEDQVARFESSLPQWQGALQQNLTAMDTTRRRLYQALGLQSGLAALGENYASLDEGLGQLYQFYSGPFEQEYYWYKGYQDAMESDDASETLNDLLTDAAFSTSFSSQLTLAVASNRAIPDWINDRILELRSITGLNLWSDWESVYAVSAFNSSPLRSIWGETAFYLFRTIPLTFVQTKTQALRQGFDDVLAPYTEASASLNSAHADLTAGTDALWERYAVCTENLFGLYEQVRRLPGSSGLSGSMQENPLSAELKVPSVTSLTASVETDAMRSSSRVTFDWSVDDENAMGEVAYGLSDDGATTIRPGSFKSVGNARSLTRYYFPQTLPLGKDGTASVVLRARGRSGHSSHRTLMFKPLKDDAGLLQTGAVYHYVPATDQTPPDRPQVDVPLNERQIQVTRRNGSRAVVIYTNTLEASWSSFDGESGIQAYEVAVGSSPGADDVADWRSVGGSRRLVMQGLELSASAASPCFVNIRAVNSQGLTSQTGHSLPVYYDRTPPVWDAASGISVRWDAAPVSNSLTPQPCHQGSIASDVHFTVPAAFVRVRMPCACDWAGRFQGHADGVVKLDQAAQYRYAFLNSASDTATAVWHEVDEFVSSTASHFVFRLESPLSKGRLIAVKAVNDLSGLAAPVLISGILSGLADPTPPHQPQLDVSWLLNGSGGCQCTLHVLRPAFDEQSGVAGYVYCVGTRPGTDNIRPLPDLESAGFDLTSAEFVQGATITLPPWTPRPGRHSYYITVTAVNSRGLSGSTICGPLNVSGSTSRPLQPVRQP